jgi:hypothetical protein
MAETYWSGIVLIQWHFNTRKKTNKMHLYLISLFQLNYPLHVSNKQVHHQKVISVHVPYSNSHASMGCLASKTIQLVF